MWSRAILPRVHGPPGPVPEELRPIAWRPPPAASQGPPAARCACGGGCPACESPGPAAPALAPGLAPAAKSEPRDPPAQLPAALAGPPGPAEAPPDPWEQALRDLLADRPDAAALFDHLLAGVAAGLPLASQAIAAATRDLGTPDLARALQRAAARLGPGQSAVDRPAPGPRPRADDLADRAAAGWAEAGALPADLVLVLARLAQPGAASEGPP